jgi:hypothetical protein
LFLDGLLIPVENLVNHRSIRWDDTARIARVYHLELDTHEVLLANGAAAESYRDDGNRRLFQNTNAAWDQSGPPPPCAPIVTNGPVVEAIWQRLLERAKPHPLPKVTGDADVHLLQDGTRIDPVAARHGLYAFEVSFEGSDLLIASRHAVPSELGLNADQRRLGVAVQRIILRQGAVKIDIDAEAECLGDGFHGYEASGAFRWTDGSASIPGAALAMFTSGEAMAIEIYLGCVARYPMPAKAGSHGGGKIVAQDRGDQPVRLPQAA